MLADPPTPRIVGRYALYDAIASGGMGTVWLGRLRGPIGFSRTVAIKSLHPHLARDPELKSMFLDEARLAARVIHPNVVATLDFVDNEGELFVVMELVRGLTLSALTKGRTTPVPPAIAAAIIGNVLQGLHAAHEAKSEKGEPLGLVHRDVSPQNVLVGADGIARLLDFGVAKAADRARTTQEGQIKGKIAYMPPEQLRGEKVSRQTDIWATGVVLWELLTGKRLFDAETEAAQLERILFRTVPSPEVSKGLDEVVLRALAAERANRYATAREMAIALQNAVSAAPPNEVAEWMVIDGGDRIAALDARVAAIEADSSAAPSGALLAAPSMPTQLSTISVAVTPPRAPTRSSRLGLVALAIAAAVAALGAGAFLRLRMNPSPPSTSLATPSDSTPPAMPPDSAPSGVASNGGVPAATPSGSASVSASATSPSSATSTAPPPPRRLPPKVDCNPPFIRNAEGVKVYKRGCL